MSDTEPSLAEIIRTSAETRERELFTAMPGRVEFVDLTATPPTAEVKPMIRRALLDTNGEIQHEEIPPIPNVPLVFPHGATFSMTWPVQSGDSVLLVFSSWSPQQWRESGDVSDPGDLRTHELGNAFAIPGISPNGTSISTSPTAAVIEVIAPTTHVNVGAAATDFVAMNMKVLSELSSIATALTAHTHSGVMAGGGMTGPSNSTYTAPVDVAATKLKSE